MWVYIAALGATLLLVISVALGLVRRKSGGDSFGVGRLSDAWLAERRRGPDPE